MNPPTSLLDTFVTLARDVGTNVHIIPRGELCARLANILIEAGARSVAVESSLRRTFPDVLGALVDAGLTVAPPDVSPADLARADVGLSLAAFAVAETGSVALSSTPVGDRLLGMLPELHVVVVRQSGLLPSLDDAAARLRDWSSTAPRPTTAIRGQVGAGAQSSAATSPASSSEATRAEEADWVESMRYVSLVTGASRTSDIERVLTIGVHGPRAVHVLVLADE